MNYKIPIIIIGLMMGALPASAFTIRPAKSLLTIEGGESRLVTIKVKNEAASSVRVAVRVLGARQDNLGRPIFGAGADEAESWIYPEAKEVIIGPAQERIIAFTISPPSGTAPGSHHVGLALSPLAVPSGGIGLKTELISLLTIQVAGVVNEHLEIVEWKVPRLITAAGSVPVTIAMSNTGTIEVPLAGQFAITSLGGREIFSSPLPLGNKLLALSTRHLEPLIDVPPGRMLPGPYRVSLRVTYGLTQQTVVRSAFIWFIPIWSLGIAGALLLGFTVFIVSRRLRSAPLH